MLQKYNKNMPKNVTKKYICKCCNYSTHVHCNYKKHLKTNKHVKNIKNYIAPKNGAKKIYKNKIK